MNKNLSKPRLNSCHCGCHEQYCPNHIIHQECINLNQSQMMPEKIDRNNSQFSLNYNYDLPLYEPQNNNNPQENCNNNLSRQEILLNQVKNEINKSDLTMGPKYNLKERALVLKDRINSLFLLKKMNNANKCIKKELDINNNIHSNISSKFTFYNQRDKTPYQKRKIQNEIKIENPQLKKMLTNIPRHEKNKSAKRQNAENMKLLFTNGIFRMKSYDAKKANNYNKKFNGYSSMIMPPNDLCRIGLINNC